MVPPLEHRDLERRLRTEVLADQPLHAADELRVLEDEELRVENARLFFARLPRRARTHTPEPLARRLERRVKARDLTIDGVIIDDALRHLGHLPQEQVHAAEYDAGRCRDAVELVLH